MPLYEFRCTECGSHVETVLSLAAYEENRDKLNCACSGKLERTFTKAPMGFVQGNFEAFKSPIDNRPIITRRELDAHNRQHNVVHMHEKYTEKEMKGMTTHKPTTASRKEILADAAEALQAVSQGYSPIIESEDVLYHG